MRLSSFILIFVNCTIFVTNSSALPDPEETVRDCLTMLAQSAFPDNETVVTGADDFMLNFVPKLQSPTFLTNFESANDGKKYQTNYLLVANDQDSFARLLETFLASKYWDAHKSPLGRYIIFINDLQDVKKAVHLLWDADILNAFIATASDEEQEVDLDMSQKKIFETLVKARVGSEVFDAKWSYANANKSVDVQIYYSHPYTMQKNRCGSVIRSAAMAKCGRVVRVRFPDYVREFNQCPSTAALADSHLPLPYIGSDLVHGKAGVMVEPLKLLAEKYNVNMTYVSKTAPNVYGKIQLEDEVNRKEIDFVVVQPYRFDWYYEKMQISDIIFYDYVVWIVPKPQKLSNIKIIASVFETSCWMVIFAVLTTLIPIWYLLVQQQTISSEMNFSRCALDIVSITLGFGITNITNRLFLIVLLLYSFHINYFFQGQLASILTSPIYEAKISTMEQLIDSRLHIVINDAINKESVLKDAQHPLSKRLYNRLEVLPSKSSYNLTRILGDKSFSNMAIKSFLSDINITDAHRLRTDMVIDTLLMRMEASYRMRKGNPYTLTINEVLKSVREGGLWMKWLSDLKKIMFLEAEPEIVVLTLQHLEMAFVMLGIGYALATGVFVYETFKGIKHNCCRCSRNPITKEF